MATDELKPAAEVNPDEYGNTDTFVVTMTVTLDRRKWMDLYGGPITSEGVAEWVKMSMYVDADPQTTTVHSAIHIKSDAQTVNTFML